MFKKFLFAWFVVNLEFLLMDITDLVICWWRNRQGNKNIE